MLSVFEIRTDSMKTTFDIDWTIIGGGGFFSSYCLMIVSISSFSPEA